MGVVAALAVGAVVAAGATAYSANQSGKAGKKAANASQNAAEQTYATNQEYLKYIKGESKKYDKTVNNVIDNSATQVGQAFGDVNTIIGNIPNLEALSDRAKALSEDDFNYRTDKTRENLDFILGSTADDLREAQTLNAGLASLDESTFTGSFQKILQSSMLGLKASTIGEPTGTFANLSARNLYDFSQQGLSNYLAINDFYSREGTVDPISPYEISNDLYNQNFAIAGLNINNRMNLLNGNLGVNDARINAAGQQYQNAQGVASLAMGISSNYNDSIAQAEGARAAARATEASGYAQATSTLVSGLTSAYGAGIQQQGVANQTNYTNALISNMNRSNANNQNYTQLPAVS